MSFKTTPYDSVCTVRIGRSLDSPNVEKLEGSTSGVMIDAKHGLVLTHASILNQLVQKLRPGKLEMLRKSGSVRGPFFEDKMNVEIILPNCNDIESVLAENKNRNDIESHIQPSLLNGSAQDTQSFSKYKGTMKMIFECRNLRRTIESTLPSDNWQFADESNNELAGKTEENHNKKTGNHEDVAFLLLPSFVLFRLKDFQPSKQSLSIRNAGSNRQGDPVEICATPFGGLSPEVFLNSRSQGIISNLAGPRGVLIMTDARCVPGSEGGALFYCGHGQRQLTGIMIASLCWKNSEWVGLSMACAMSELMGNLQGYMTLDNDQQMTAPTFTGSYGSKFAEELGRFLAYVRVGNSWGSAVAISPADGTYLIHADVYNFTLGSKFAEDLGRFLAYVHVGNSWGSAVAISPADGTYLTCSHVLNGMEPQGVSISGNDANQKLQCQVVYRTPGHSHFDLAVIKLLDNSNLKHRLAPVQFGKAQEGEVVYVVGHALFRSDHHLAPTVTRGIVSKVVRFNNVPVIMMTTCAVHAGASGGGVFNKHGQLVAIAVCNSKDTSSGACYPHVNMCVPMETIAPVIRQYFKTNDPSILKNLGIENKRVHQMWNIGTETATISHL